MKERKDILLTGLWLERWNKGVVALSTIPRRLHRSNSRHGVSRMSSIKGHTLSSLIPLRFFKSEGEILRVRREDCTRVSEPVKWIDGSKRSGEGTVNSPARNIRKLPLVMAAHRAVSSSHLGMIKAWISEWMSNGIKRHLLFRCRRMFAFDTTQGLF